MKLVGAALATLVFLAAPRAEASCGNPHWVGTPPGAAIPPAGSLYLYDHALVFRAPTPRPTPGPIVRETVVGDGVVRLDYATSADELEIADQWNPTVFPVHGTWKPPAAAPRVIQYWHQVHAWACSSADLVWLQIDQPTAAFRVVWQAKGKPARQFIFPALTDTNNVSVLPLGKLDCAGTTIDPAELAEGGRLTLFAIRFDGSEVAVRGLPSTISTAAMPTTEDGIERAIGFQAGTEPTQPVPPPDHDWPFHLFLLLLIPAAALLWVAVRDRSVKAVV